MTIKTFVFAVLSLLSVEIAFAACSQVSDLTAKERFTKNRNGTILDKATGLQWKQCLERYSENQCRSPNYGDAAVTFNRAFVIATFANGDAGANVTDPVYMNDVNRAYAGYNDWRLPNIKELSSLLDLQCAPIALNPNIFVLGNTEDHQFYEDSSESTHFTVWSSTADIKEEGVDKKAFVVNFKPGINNFVESQVIDNKANVWLVRGGDAD